jgi:hypothetical protein
LPSWVPWAYRPRPGTHGRPSTDGPSQGGVPQWPPHQGGQPSHGGPAGKPSELPSKECGDLVNGGRQLIEAFCPKSCGRCGKSSSPVVAAKVYVNAQCAVAKEPTIGLAAQ